MIIKLISILKLKKIYQNKLMNFVRKISIQKILKKLLKIKYKKKYKKK